MTGRRKRNPNSFILVKHCSIFEINVLVIGALLISGVSAWVVQDTIGQFALELDVDLPFLPQTRYEKSLLDLRLVSTLSLFWNGGARILALLFGFGSFVLPLVCILLWATILFPLKYSARKHLLLWVRHLGKWQTCLMFTLMLVNKGVSFEKTIGHTWHSALRSVEPGFGHIKTHMEIISKGGCINGLYVLSLIVLFTAAIENVNERSFYKTTRKVLPRITIPCTWARIIIVFFATIGLVVTLVMFFASTFVGPFIEFKQAGVLANVEPRAIRHSTLTIPEAMDTSNPREPSRTYFLIGIVIAPIAESLLLIIRATLNRESRLSLLLSTITTSFNLQGVFMLTLIAVVANIDELTKFLVAKQSQGICEHLKIHYHQYCFQTKAQYESSSLLVVTTCVSFFAARCITWMTAKPVAPKINSVHNEGLTQGLIINKAYNPQTSASTHEWDGEKGDRLDWPKLTPFVSDEPMQHYAGAEEEEGGVYHYLHHLVIPGEVEMPLSPSASPKFEPEIANITYSRMSSTSKS